MTLVDALWSLGVCLQESDGRRVLQQLLDGLDHCHQQGIYHRSGTPPLLGGINCSQQLLSLPCCLSADLPAHSDAMLSVCTAHCLQPAKLEISQDKWCADSSRGLLFIGKHRHAACKPSYIIFIPLPPSLTMSMGSFATLARARHLILLY